MSINFVGNGPKADDETQQRNEEKGRDVIKEVKEEAPSPHQNKTKPPSRLT